MEGVGRLDRAEAAALPSGGLFGLARASDTDRGTFRAERHRSASAPLFNGASVPALSRNWPPPLARHDRSAARNRARDCGTALLRRTERVTRQNRVAAPHRLSVQSIISGTGIRCWNRRPHIRRNASDREQGARLSDDGRRRRPCLESRAGLSGPRLKNTLCPGVLQPCCKRNCCRDRQNPPSLSSKGS